ncbi:MAG TPA: ABC transporter ATP-binding protein [Alphaproteobacteria bacterium]|nr:ABC transporter ATP-binding protein [Alphaproteobacteria bacterium]
MRTGASVSVRNLSKHYGPVVAVDGVSLDIGSGEFIALLGPSGSGKSTILMSIAGFEVPSAGEIFIGAERITSLPPHRRGIGMVFQRYALFPHLTVAENIAYPLRRRGTDRATIEREVARTLELVCLKGLGARYPSQLSGGQQQRVALARALVFRPSVLLMDEPLGALDRKLRQQMQMEIKLLHREIGTTIVFVTHDQEEALSMADRVAVLNQGKVQQIGAPDSLYNEPETAFVADFIGETNFIPVEIGRQDGGAEVRPDGSPAAIRIDAANLRTGAARGLLAVRPEHLLLSTSGPGIPATVVETAYTGPTMNVLVEAGSRRLIARVTPDRAAEWETGQRVVLMPQASRCRVYPLET